MTVETDAHRLTYVLCDDKLVARFQFDGADGVMTSEQKQRFFMAVYNLTCSIVFFQMEFGNADTLVRSVCVKTALRAYPVDLTFINVLMAWFFGNLN